MVVRKLIGFDDDTFDKLTQLGRDRMATEPLSPTPPREAPANAPAAPAPVPAASGPPSR